MTQITHKKDPADAAAEEYFGKEQTHCRKGENIALGVSFLLFLLVFLALFFILPKKEYSKTENKLLSSFPELTAESLFGAKFFKRSDNTSDDFTTKTEKYIEDHFPLKDQIFEGYALYSLALGRAGSGGVFVGKDGYLLKEQYYASEKQEDALRSYETIFAGFAKKLPLTVAVAPTGSQFLRDKLPGVAAPSVSVIESNRALILETFSGDKDYRFLDLEPALEAHRDEELYYRTDHHWTTLGALYGVNAVREELGKEVRAPENYNPETVTDRFYGTLSAESGIRFTADTIEYYRYGGDENYTVRTLDARGEVVSQRSGFYDRSCLEEDHRGTAYDSFVTPVGPRVEISDGNGGKERLLVLKDSYAHCALPFLAEDYDLIVLDVRPQSGHLTLAKKLIDEGLVDGVLVLVSTDTLLG